MTAKVITESQTRLFDNIIRDLGVINDFLENDDVNEIMINSNKKMFIDTASKGLVYIKDVPSATTLRIIKSLADYSSQIINETTQFITLEMPIYKTMNGERFTAQIPPLSPSPSFTLRKKPKEVYPLRDLIKSKRATVEQVDILTEAAQPGALEDGNPVLIKLWGDKLESGEMKDLSKESRLAQFPKNIVFCGGPGSGKTTTMNSTLQESVNINPKQRYVVVEKLMSEVQCRGEHVQQLISNSIISMSKCVEIAMVSRPDRIIVGEVKGAEAHDMCKAWNTGTPGGMSTVHANNPKECFQRIGDLCMESGLVKAPWNLILITINVVVWIGKQGSQKGFIKEILLTKGSEHEETKFLDKINFTKV